MSQGGGAAPRPGASSATGHAKAGAGRSFGEEGGLLTYGSYLHVPGLLAQQVPQAVPSVHDEMLFIVVHQAYELWFRQLLHELTAVRDAMLGAGGERQAWRARQLLQRVHVIERLLVGQIDVLETMTPQDFGEFRSVLAPASGFQSVQFRELEFLSGAKDPGFVAKFRSLTDAERARLQARLAEPSLWDAYVDLMASAGLPAADDKQILASLVSVARDRPHHDDLWQLAEDLLTHDELAGLWRARHVQMVERQIGTKSGTGGSTGAPYLQRRVPLRYYPLLWELRDSL
ncbi:MAG TPA: tryptophan 2,3-dioxygenase family protein [Streptosporangiaceae bacterium]|jgi:tryptophan 2,3-dioxygenase